MKLEGLTKARQDNRLADRRETVAPTLSLWQRFGARLMNGTGVALDSVNPNKNYLSEVSKLRQDAYETNARASRLRKRAAAIGTSAITGLALFAVSWTVDTYDNANACFDSVTTTMDLKFGDNLETLAGEIPHRNTPIDAVVDNIMAMNTDLVGKDSNGDPDPKHAHPGTYEVSTGCNSNQDIIPAFLTFLGDLPGAGATRQDLGSSQG